MDFFIFMNNQAIIYVDLEGTFIVIDPNTSSMHSVQSNISSRNRQQSCVYRET